MSRTQIADDPGVKIRAPWLGPAGGWRWPWDASYSSWALWGGATVVGGALLHFAIPAGLIIGGGAYSLSRYVAGLLAPERTALVRRGLFSVLLVLLALSVPYWRVWAFPMSFWAALLVAPAVGVWVVRRYGKFVDANRPIAYWLTVPGAAARGPRADKADEIDPARLALGLKMEELSEERDYVIQVPAWSGPFELNMRAKPKPPVVKAKITKLAKQKVNPVEKRLVPTSKAQHSTRFIARTERGIRIGNTEFRTEA